MRSFIKIFENGTKIAFSASPDGNTNVFVMPSDGGEITQLTFHEAADMVDSWSWDNQGICFHSSRENMSAIYRINIAGGNIRKVSKGGSKMESISIDHAFSRNLANEFSQIFYETWAALDENFYADDFHGVDWPGMRDRYAEHLPFVGTREDLRRLLNDMLGELNASHTGFASFGDEERTFYSARSAETGLVFSDESPMKVELIISRSNFDLSEPVVEPGDILVSVNGRVIPETGNRNRYFYFPELPEELVLQFAQQRQ